MCKHESKVNLLDSRHICLLSIFIIPFENLWIYLVKALVMNIILVGTRKTLVETRKILI